MSESSHEPGDVDRIQLISLVRGARDGAADAMDQLLSTIRPQIRRLAHASLTSWAYRNGRCDASDVTQTTLLDVMRGLGKFLGTTDKEFIAWLKQAVERNVFDEVRRHLAQKRDIGRERSVEDRGVDGAALGDRLAAPALTPSQGLMRLEDCSRVTQALAQLPVELREVVRLKDIEGLPMTEIAQRLSINQRTAYRRYHQALDGLEELIYEDV